MPDNQDVPEEPQQSATEPVNEKDLVQVFKLLADENPAQDSALAPA